MIWSEFVAAVNEHLVTDATRRGIETFNSRQIRNAVIDIQRFVPYFRTGNTTTYQLGDLTAVGCAHLVGMPDGCQPKACYTVGKLAGQDGNIVRHRMDFYPWKEREALIRGELNFGSWWGALWGGNVPPVTPPQVGWNTGMEWLRRKGYCYSVGPHGRNFLIYPQINAATELLLVWDGIKTSFQGTDEVPFNDQCAEATAAFVKTRIGAYVNNDPTLAQMAMQDWVTLRRKLYTDWRQTQQMESHDEEYEANQVIPTPGFGGFGPAYIPLLQGVNVLLGAGSNALQAIPTIALQVPQTVMIIIGGINTLWTLNAGTDATDVPNGIVDPGDFNAISNAKVWYQSST